MTEESAIANSFHNLADWIDEADKIVDRAVGPDEELHDQVQIDLRALASFLDQHTRIAQRLSAVLADGEWIINTDELSEYNEEFETCDDPDCGCSGFDDTDMTSEEFEDLILTDKGRLALLEIEVERLRASLDQVVDRVLVLEARVPYQPYQVQPYTGWTCSTCGTFVSPGTVHQCGNQWTSPFIYSGGHPISDKIE